MDFGNTTKTVVFESLAEVLKALGSGRRLELVELLAQGEHPVETLARMSGMALTTTSAHLQTLKQAGLVRTRRERTTVHYRLAGDDVASLYVAAKRVGLLRSSRLRDAVAGYLSDADGAPIAPTIDPASVTADMTVIDVRPASEFADGHFPGALSIPLATLAERMHELPTTNAVVVYCRGEFCRLAREAAHMMREHGINASAMDEGIIEWRASKAVDIAGVPSA